MAEFLTMDEAKSKFGTKGRTNAGLTEPLHATITSDATSSTSTAEDPTYSR